MYSNKLNFKVNFALIKNNIYAMKYCKYSNNLHCNNGNFFKSKVEPKSNSISYTPKSDNLN